MGREGGELDGWTCWRAASALTSGLADASSPVSRLNCSGSWRASSHGPLAKASPVGKSTNRAHHSSLELTIVSPVLILPSSARTPVALLLPLSSHRSLRPLRPLHRQLRPLRQAPSCPSSPRHRLASASRLVQAHALLCTLPHHPQQIVIVVILLSMDFWNTRVRHPSFAHCAPLCPRVDPAPPASLANRTSPAARSSASGTGTKLTKTERAPGCLSRET